MRLNEESIEFIYENLTALFSLNLIVSDCEGNPLKRLNTIELSEVIQEAEAKIFKKIAEKLLGRGREAVYYIESDKKFKYIGLGVYEDEECIGMMILGPYVNDFTLSIMIHETEKFVYEYIPILSRVQEKAVANIVLNMINSAQLHSVPVEIEEKEIEASALNYTLDDYAMNIEGIKQRYKAEKKLLYYVSQGNKSKVLDLLNRDSLQVIEKMNRFPDNPLRGVKNMMIVLNSLLRKSVEKSGVDEYFIHIISENFAIEIEGSKTSKELSTIMMDMVLEYCNLVNEHNTRVYSDLVARAITYMKLNFRKDIGLASIAKELFIHPTYLAKRFKIETNKTVSEYVNEVRIQEAKFMLKATEFRVEDIAYYVGYNDKKYFSKMFKKMIGISPSEYRQYNES